MAPRDGGDLVPLTDEWSGALPHAAFAAPDAPEPHPALAVGGNPESQQTLVSMAVVVSPFDFSEMQGEGESGQVWEPVCRFFHWTSVARRAVV